jgi:ABC-type multidrug transport system fused ATPase/permease subunit
LFSGVFVLLRCVLFVLLRCVLVVLASRLLDICSNVMATYLAAMGAPLVSFMLVCVILTYVVMAGADRWLAYWISAAEKAELEGTDIDNALYAGVYASLSLGFLGMMIFSSTVFNEGAAKAGRSMHRDCLIRIMHAPMEWFESNPSGRVLSRFSTDIAWVDLRLCEITDTFLQFTVSHSAQSAKRKSFTTLLTLTVASPCLQFTILALCVVICLIVPPISIAIAVGFICFMFQYVAIDRSNREIKRMTNSAMSPILTNMSEICRARFLIRTMELGAFFHARHCRFADYFNRLNYFSSAIFNWGMLFGSILSAVIATGTAMSILAEKEKYDPTLAGLALTYGFLLPYFLQMYSGILTFLKLSLTALERLLEYKGDEVTQERAWYEPGDKSGSLASWPQSGMLVFEDVTLVYREGLAPAITDVSFRIESGERCGIIGRTGAGKTSLMVLLFRVHEATAGRILVDGADIACIGLQTLRKMISVIPQEPLLLTGTVRENLDPFGKLDDEVLARVLGEVGLGQSNDASTMLDVKVGGGGKYLSAGERQLIGFARTLLRKSKLVVMDGTYSCLVLTFQWLSAVDTLTFALMAQY